LSQVCFLRKSLIEPLSDQVAKFERISRNSKLNRKKLVEMGFEPVTYKILTFCFIKFPQVRGLVGPTALSDCHLITE